jgi:filamentous hemagglutinin
MRSVARLLVFPLIVLLILPPHVFAENPITPAPNAPANMRPGMDKAPNGVPLVDIVAPNASGLSHNMYQDFNVNKQGLIFNNALSDVQTQLGGMVPGNPNFSGKSAGVILNEVTGGNRSTIEGHMEIAGDKADLILANPSGVTVNGGGFINVGAAAFTTGKPVVQNGTLSGFDVTRGNVRIEGVGIDATQSDAFSIFSRTAEIAADVHAKDLKIVTGKNRVKGNRGESVTPLAEEQGETKPVVGIDSTAVGGMYANRITLIATEKGVGVNLEGTAHSASEMRITADGKLVLREVVSGGDAALASKTEVSVGESAYAVNNLDVRAREVKTSGILASGNSTKIRARELDLQQGAVAASGVDASGNLTGNGNTKISAKQVRADKAQVLGGGSVTINAEKTSLQDTTVAAAQNAAMSGGNLEAFSSRILGARILLDITDISLAQKTALEALNALDLRASTLNMNDSAATSGADLSAFVDTAALNADSALAAPGDLWITGGDFSLNDSSLIAGQDLQYSGASLTSVGGALYAGRDQRLFTVGHLLNDSGDIYAGRDIYIGSADGLGNNTVRNLSGTIAAADGSLYINADTVENNKASFSITRDGISLGSSFTSVDIDFGDREDRTWDDILETYTRDRLDADSPQGVMTAAQHIEIKANTFTNAYSRVAAGKTITSIANTINEISTALYDKTTRRIDHCHDDENGRFVFLGSETRIFLTPLQYFNATITANETLTLDVDTFSNLQQRGQGVEVANPSALTAAYRTNSAMFRPVSAPGRRYLIETNPYFTVFGLYYGSEYFMSRMGFNLADMTLPFLGDAFYETRLVQDQILAVTGKRFLSGYGSDADQMRGLMDNAAEEAQALNLAMGVSLSSEQVAALTRDIIWLVEEEYMGQKVLVPHLYLAAASREDASPSGGLVARNVYVNAGDKIMKDRKSVV